MLSIYLAWVNHHVVRLPGRCRKLVPIGLTTFAAQLARLCSIDEVVTESRVHPLAVKGGICCPTCGLEPRVSCLLKSSSLLFGESWIQRKLAWRAMLAGDQEGQEEHQFSNHTS